MTELSQRVQDMVTVLCTSLYAARSDDELVREAGDIACQDLIRKLQGRRPTDRYFRQVTALGEKIADGGFRSIEGLVPDKIMMPYQNEG